MWDFPGPGIKLVSPALQGGFLTTGPPGKSRQSVFPGTSRFPKIAGESTVAQMSSAVFRVRTCYPSHSKDSCRISCEAGCVWVETKQNQVPGITKQQKRFQCYPKVAWLQDPSRLVLWEAWDEWSKPFEKCPLEFMKISKEEKIQSGNFSRWKWHFHMHKVPTVQVAKCLHVLLVDCIFR